MLVKFFYVKLRKIMQKISLKAEERELLGKKVKSLRKNGFIPAHVYGNGEGENIAVLGLEFLKVFDVVGETGLIDLKIGEEKIRPVLVRDIQVDPVKDDILHIDFYQVNLKEKVTVPVPLVLKELEEEIESVKMGEAVVLQTLSEVEVEALPTELIDEIEVDIRSLKNVDDAITVGDLLYDREKLTVLAEPEEVVVKLAPAVTEEMKALMEEQEAEATAAQAEEVAEEGGEEALDEVSDESAEAGGGEESEQDDSQDKTES